MKKWYIVFPIIFLCIVLIVSGSFFGYEFYKSFNYKLGYKDFGSMAVSAVSERYDRMEDANEFLEKAVQEKGYEREEYAKKAAEIIFSDSAYLVKLQWWKLDEFEKELVDLDILYEDIKKQLDDISEKEMETEDATELRSLVDEHKELIIEQLEVFDRMMEIQILLVYNGRSLD